MGNDTTVTVWSNSVPKKVCIFFWRAKLGKLPSRSVLDKIGVDLDSSLCLRCGEGVETVEHALVTCEEIKTLWRMVGRWWGVDVENSTTLHDLLEAGKQRGDKDKGNRRWGAVVWSFSYLIWANRNKRVFGGINGLISEHFFDFQLKAFEWVTRRDNDLKADMAAWLTDPYGA